MKFINKLYNYIFLILLIALLVFGYIFMPNINLEYKTFDISIIIIYSLITSFHCASMCGGIIITRVLSLNNNSRAKKETIKYISGRIISYTLMGMLLGAFGSLISISDKIKGCISIIAGILMILIAMQILNIIHLPKMKTYPKLKSKSSFIIGLINVFMPCGSLYIIMLYAIASSSLLYGGLSMLIFSLITSISLIMVAFLTSKIKRGILLFKYISVVIIVILSVGFISRGITCIRVGDANKISSDKVINEEKKESITLTIDYGYKANKNKIKVGIQTTMNFKVVNYNHCTHLFYIVIPGGEKIEVNLDNNHDPVTFTPKNTGTITITCFMDMKKTTIEVVK